MGSVEGSISVVESLTVWSIYPLRPQTNCRKLLISLASHPKGKTDRKKWPEGFSHTEGQNIHRSIHAKGLRTKRQGAGLSRATGRMEPRREVTGSTAQILACVFSYPHPTKLHCFTASGERCGSVDKDKEFAVFHVSRMDALGEIAELDNMNSRSKSSYSGTERIPRAPGR